MGLALALVYDNQVSAASPQQSGREFLQLLVKVIQLEPNNVWAAEYLAISTGQRDPDEASSNLEAQRHLESAERWFAAGRYKEALGEYQMAEKFDPKHSTIQLYMGDAYFALNQWDNAIQRYKKAAELNPKNFRAWRFLGDTYERQGLLNEAREAYEKALTINPDYLLAKWNLQNVVSKIKKKTN